VGQRSDEIREDIERTRGDLSTSLDVLGDRVSPRRAAQRSVSGIRGRFTSVRETVMGSPGSSSGMPGSMSSAADRGRELRDPAGDAASGAVEQFRDAPDTMRENVAGNPLAAGIIAFGAGLLVGSIIPPTEAEKRMAPSLADDLQPAVERAKDAALEAKSELQESARDAAGQVKEHASAAAQDVKEQAKTAAAEVKDQTKDSAEEMKSRTQDAAKETASSARSSG
jgi:Protein of unknown function (DUF3618)